MAKNLVVVESPAKARTLSRFLGGDYHIEASLGHVRDLPQKKLGVDVEHDFAPEYEIIRGRAKTVKEIKDAAKGASAIYLATDPDREGEAISWHLAQAAGLRPADLKRVVFHEITEKAVREAFRHPRDIDMKLVQAQQARRVLDRLVGYRISPLLWKRVRPGLSAGRVQSVAVRMVVDRENEIAAFTPEEYWNIDAELAKEQGGGPSFRARLLSALGGKKLRVRNQGEADRYLGELQGAGYRVQAVQQKTSPRQPSPPFTTSTLQQEAWRKLRYSAKRTMALAQQLYEGLPLGDDGPMGLITYMRTDSTRVSAGAVSEARDYVAARYGADFLPASARAFTRKAKGAQEAHEAIRPTAIAREPERLEPHLSRDQLRLYTLIWKRMLASQMAAAQAQSTQVDVAAQTRAPGQGYLLRATSTVITFPGFTILYTEGRDEEEDQDDRPPLPPLAEGEALKLLGLFPEQRFTQPPPRYSEATLVKALEENGIGRPSTYAPILSLIQDRGYVEKKAGRFEPTELGILVDGLLRNHFAPIVDVGFTARMEKGLDEVAGGRGEWVPMVRDFYVPLEEMLQTATRTVPKHVEPTDEVCELCGRPMVIKWGRRGKFLSCSGFPECKNARSIKVPASVPCPQCSGELVERRSRKGRTFYGCDHYPECTFTTSGKPMPEPCPECGGLLTITPRGRAKCTRCDFTGDPEEIQETARVPVGGGKP